MGLEPSVTKLGGGVDELEVDLLQSPLLGVSQQRLTKGQNPLLRSNAATLSRMILVGVMVENISECIDYHGIYSATKQRVQDFNFLYEYFSTRLSQIKTAQ